MQLLSLGHGVLILDSVQTGRVSTHDSNGDTCTLCKLNNVYFNIWEFIHITPAVQKEATSYLSRSCAAATALS